MNDYDMIKVKMQERTEVVSDISYEGLCREPGDTNKRARLTH